MSQMSGVSGVKMVLLGALAASRALVVLVFNELQIVQVIRGRERTSPIPTHLHPTELTRR